MLTDLKNRKFSHGFDLMDTGKKGYLERADFEGLAKRLAEARGVSLYSEEGEQLVARYSFVWSGVKSMADTNHNNQVDRAEWLLYHERLLSNADEFSDLIENLASFMFDMLDLDSDGKITPTEHKIFFKAYQLPEAQAEEIFKKLDRNADGHLSRDEVMDAVREFYHSDDPATLGNLLFGNF